MSLLTQDQIDFLTKETAQNKVDPPEDFNNLTEDELDRLQGMCCIIEEVEAAEHDPITPRGKMAADLADLLYNM